MLRKSLMSAVIPALTLTTTAAAADEADGRGDHARARLRPAAEVPALSSAARGQFTATIDEANQTISYEVSYEGLEGDVQQAHIHVGQRGVNGGISVFLCGNPPTVPPETVPQPPACPPPPATVTGVVMAQNIIGPEDQGIAPTAGMTNEFQELVNLLRSGLTYANVHSSKFPAGEIRGQIHVRQRNAH